MTPGEPMNIFVLLSKKIMPAFDLLLVFGPQKKQAK
jgi:hypothetical protein